MFLVEAHLHIQLTPNDLECPHIIRKPPSSLSNEFFVILDSDDIAYCGHSTFECVTTELKRCWYSADVMNEQTIACCVLPSRNGPRFTWPSQKRNPAISA